MDTVTATGPAGPAAGGPVLVVDAGSSSLHLRVLDEDLSELAARDFTDPPGDDADHMVTEFLHGAPEVVAAGHRLVHGGPRLTSATLVDAEVRELLQDVADLAPLHMPPALAVLDAARSLLPDIPHVACPDTAFHAHLPEAARTYALPRKWNHRYGLRRYGFHGLSYSWALARAADLLARPAGELQLVLTHLGGGCSACAVRDGGSVDTTMGFTPLEGLTMSRRSGSIDPGLLLWLQKAHALTPDDLVEALNRESGLLGLSGTSGDTRDLVRAREHGDPDAALALEVFTVDACRGIAAMAASLDRIDALVFTGEIGTDQPEIREAVCARLATLGIQGGLDPDDPQRATAVSPPGARVPVLVVPTGETQQIAAETLSVTG
ncbi:acetate/propionate family kinase [Streptomyces sp. NPDC091204]|uniref:acetate/propionate family kinase n=1 Tax=Streptomyces sp. NPDC091204 TaxID=3155299 RepID=UPI00341377F8